MVKSNHHCWTLNNYTDEEVIALKDSRNRDHRITYMLFGFEIGDKGTPHLQGYTQFSTRVDFTVLHRICSRLSMRTETRGSSEDNEKYCKKDNNFFEDGEIKSIGRKLKRPASQAFDLIRDDILSGASIAEIATNYPTEFIKHHAGIVKMAKILNTEKLVRFFGPFPEYLYRRIAEPLHDFDWQRSVVVVGETGLCKTQFVLSLFENPLCVSNTEELKSFRRLEHDAIIFDDVSVAHWPRNSQLHIADVEVARGINVKGSHVTIPAFTKKVFTCNPWEWPFIKNDPAIDRRLFIINLE